MKYHALLLAAVIGLAACKEKSTDEKLIGTWQETQVINPQMDQALADQRIFRDTVGTSTTPAQNLKLYGVADADSFRQLLTKEIDNATEMRAEAIRTTRYEFMKGGSMIIHTGGSADTCAWSLDEDGALVLDEGKLKGTDGMRLRFDILSLSDTSLKLQYTENYLSSTTVFRSVKK